MNLSDILILAFVCNKEPDYVINQDLLDKIIILGEQICLADSVEDYYEWRTYKENKPKFNKKNSIYQNTIFLAHEFMPKMSGDSMMINKYFDMLSDYKPKPINPNTSHPTCIKCAHGQTPKYTGIDIHCYPNMILKLQAITRKQYTTQQLSSCIWELNSKYSNRKPNEINLHMVNSNIVNKMFDIQKEFWNEYVNPFDIIGPICGQEVKLSKCAVTKPMDKFSTRTIFLKIFGFNQHLAMLEGH